MTMNPAVSMSHCTAPSFPVAAPGPSYQIVGELKPQNFIMTSSFPPNPPQGLSAFPNTLLVTGLAGSGLNEPGAGKVMTQYISEATPVQLPGTQTFTMTRAPHIWSVPGALSGAVQYAPPHLGAAPVGEQVFPLTYLVSTQPDRGGWSTALPVQSAPPPVQMASIFPHVKLHSGPQGSSGEESLVTAPLSDTSCNSKSVYQNYRHWQSFKPLAREYHPHSPDTEALSCFLIPVLRTLARLKPNMTLGEGLQRAFQEWQYTSNFDRMVFYEIAAKFMEFESEEEEESQIFEHTNGSTDGPSPAPTGIEPHECSVPMVPNNPALISKKGGAKVQSYDHQENRSQQNWEPKAPKEIPPEAVQEYIQIVGELQLHGNLAAGEPDGQWETEGYEEQQHHHQEQPRGQEPQEQADRELCSNPGFLSYLDELYSQEEFVTQVEAVIHPRFIAMLLSPDPHEDPLSLRGELEQEEKLSLSQLVEKRLLELQGDVNAERFPVPPMETMGSKTCAEEDQEELPSLAFLLASHQSPLPWDLPKSPLPDCTIPYHGLQRSGSTSQAQASETRSHKHAVFSAVQSKLPAPVRALSSPDTRSCAGVDLPVFGRQPLAGAEVQTSGPLKRKCHLSENKERKKRRVPKHCALLLFEPFSPSC
ncbi:NUT family member 2G-like [Rhynchocyon petersi]